MFKWVIHSILVVELYGMTHGFDIRAVIQAILEKMLGSAILLILS